MNRCRVANCLRERMPDALVCRDHMVDLWKNRLDRGPEGFAEPEWMRRRRTVGLPAKDITRSAA